MAPVSINANRCPKKR